MSMRSAAKVVAYRTGAMNRIHSWRNRETLTVVMFHRVLDAKEMENSSADPLYTVTPKFLQDSLSFLRRHYALVSLEEVLLSRNGQKALPRFAALITFDDGWQDNLSFAASVLHGIPWTVFVASDALSAPEYWWQEVLEWAMRTGAASQQQLWELASLHGASDSTPADEEDPHALLIRYGTLSTEDRERALANFHNSLRRKGIPRHMLTSRDLTTLHEAGASIGCHGASHLPLPLLQDADEDIRRARDVLMTPADPLSGKAMSFPHGHHNQQVTNAARSLGYRLMFTSDPVLNPCPKGWLSSDLIGRIPVTIRDVADESGNFVPAKMAPWIFLRECRALDGDY